MKNILLATIFMFFAIPLEAQNLQGAWEATKTNEQGVDVQHVMIIAGDFVSEAFFQRENGKFLGTWGGGCQVGDNIFTHTFEYATFDSQLVGTTKSTSYAMENGKIHMGDKIWTRIDNGSPGDLAGAWLFSGRMQDGEIRKRDTSGPRKTMKILSGTRFQWIAYNTETKEFMGTGGGTYTTVDGKYTENIGFFSRDDSRVGVSLQFDYSLEDGDWHHSGLSSKGLPIYEIWSLRSK